MTTTDSGGTTSGTNDAGTDDDASTAPAPRTHAPRARTATEPQEAVGHGLVPVDVPSSKDGEDTDETEHAGGVVKSDNVGDGVRARPDDGWVDPRTRARRFVDRQLDVIKYDRWRAAEALVSLVVVAGATILVLAATHPNLVLRNTTPTGGDMGSHVWGPMYLMRHLLPKGRLSGWTARLVRRLPRVPVLHGRSLAVRRRIARRASAICSPIPVALGMVASRSVDGSPRRCIGSGGHCSSSASSGSCWSSPCRTTSRSRSSRSSAWSRCPRPHGRSASWPTCRSRSRHC